ncbi:MAG TPA: hypothetical protein VMX12_06050 [Acidimicrobiia bacterium]|nr:hypothetical protein [Acidimicrobiia bacterium]
MSQFRVVQWATGVVGTSALKGIVRHPKLELAGVKVYSDEKKGRDAGDLAGIAPTGVIATQDVDEILALEADCILYCPLPWDLGEICRILETGTHVVTPCPYWFPFVQNPDVAKAIGESCKRGGVNFHASGCNPGGIAERFPLTFTGWCNQIDRITMTECGDCTTYSSEGVMRTLMNLGATPDQARNNPLKKMLAGSWNEPIDMIAEGLGTRVVEYEAEHDFILANQDIETAVGIIAKDTIALNHYRHTGITEAGTEIVQEQIWYVDTIEQKKLQKKMDIPRESGWRIKLEGDVNLNIDVDFPPDSTQDQRVAWGLSTTAFHCVNAIPLVCAAPDPGIKTFLDLPLITGCMGTSPSAR